MEKTVNISNSQITAACFGSYDSNIARLEAAFGVKISNRQNPSDIGDTVIISGEADAVTRAFDAFSYLVRLASLGSDLGEQTVDYVISMAQDGNLAELDLLDEDCFCVTQKGRPVKAKTVGQKRYVDMIRKNSVVFGVGPAGTGKTYLAVAMAVKSLKARETSRIILTRPAVEAGERLGFLTGDLQSKIDPYLRPLYDALYEMLGTEGCARLIEKQTIEIAPLAYMRGRTLDDAFIILDEAQNTTSEQMKMFLTRLGNGSKMVITGDLTQRDLPFGKKSGLAEAVKILRGIDNIAIHEFTEKDVVRHRLVQKIIVAYERHERDQAAAESDRRQQYRAKRQG